MTLNRPDSRRQARAARRALLAIKHGPRWAVAPTFDPAKVRARLDAWARLEAMPSPKATAPMEATA